jgi:hypothetical protein
LPDLLELVLLLLSRQVLHLAQYDWCRGLSPLQLHAWRLQEAANASADGVATDIARRLKELHAEVAAVSSSRSSSNSNDGAYVSGLLASLKHQLSDGMAEAVVNAAHLLGSKVREAAGQGALQAAAAAAAAESCSSRSLRCELLTSQALQLLTILQLPTPLLQLWVFNPPPGEEWIARDKSDRHQAQLNVAVGSHIADTAGLATTLQLLGPLLQQLAEQLEAVDWEQPSRANLVSLHLVQYLPGMMLWIAGSFADVDADTAAAAVQCASWAQNASASAADSVHLSACRIAARQNQNADPDAVPLLPAPPVLKLAVQLLQQLLIQQPRRSNQQQQQQRSEASTSEAAQGQQPAAAVGASSSAAAAAAAASTPLSSASAAGASTSAAAAGQQGGWSTQQKRHTAYILLKMISDDLLDYDGYCRSSWHAEDGSWVQLAAVLEAFLRTQFAPILRMPLEESRAAEGALSAVLQPHSREREMYACTDIDRCLWALLEPMAQAAAAAAPGSPEQQQFLSLLLSLWKLGVTEMVDPSQMRTMWQLDESYRVSVKAACTVVESLMSSSSHGESSSTTSATASSSSSSNVPTAAEPWLALLGRYLATRVNGLGVIYVGYDPDTGDSEEDHYKPMQMLRGMRDELDVHVRVVELLRSAATPAAALDGPAWPAAAAAAATAAGAAAAVPEVGVAQAAAAATAGLHQCAAHCSTCGWLCTMRASCCAWPSSSVCRPVPDGRSRCAARLGMAIDWLTLCLGCSQS